MSNALNELMEIKDEALLKQINDGLTAFEKLTTDTEKRTAKGALIGLVAQIASPIVLDEIRESAPKKLGMSKNGYDKAVKDARAAYEEQQNELRIKMRKEQVMVDAEAAAVAEAEALTSDGGEWHPAPPTSAPHDYVTFGGMIQIETTTTDKETGDENTSYSPVCTFTAQIVGEVRDEFDNVSYKIAGNTIRSGDFTTEVTGEVFGTPGKLKIALESAAGALETVFPKMEQHLGPAIKLLSTDTNVQRFKRYDRTGWIDGKFYMPGRESDGVKVELPVILPYQSSGITDMPAAINSLALLLKALQPTVAPIMLSAVMGPPVASLAGMSNHRYAFMLKGQTGTYKTGTTMAYMSIWGQGFLDKDNLIKLGTGGTGNAIMHLATRACDTSLYLDNYKSNTDRDSEFIKLLHATLEGGERLRMETRRNALRDIRKIQTWPIITGEDVPATDPATTARLLLVSAKKQPDGIPAGILAKNAKHLHQIGTATLDWLETDEGRAAAASMDDIFVNHQRTWREYLLSQNPGMPNVDRVASTLAINQAVFAALSKHPTYGSVLLPYLDQHHEGLEQIAKQMSGTTTEGLEAVRFIEAIREMLATGRVILIKNAAHENGLPTADRDRVIGREDETGGAYLFPKIARLMVERMGIELSKMSDAAIGNQLMELGWIKSFDDGRTVKTRKINGKSEKTLHVNERAISTLRWGVATGGGDDSADDDGETMVL